MNEHTGCASALQSLHAASVNVADSSPLHELLRRNGQDTAGYYADLQQLAGTDRVFRDEALQAWIVTGYESCRVLLASRALSKERLRFDELGLPAELGGFIERAQAVVDRQMIFDESEHAVRSRHAWAHALSAGHDRALHARLAQSAHALMVEFAHSASADFYEAVLRPYVSRTIASKLGLAEEERRKLYQLIYKYANFLDGKALECKDVSEALLSVLLLNDFVAARFETLRNIAPLTAYDRERWTADCILNLVAGHESTAYALGVALLHYRSISGALDSQQAIGNLVNEALRFDSPIQMVGRVARKDITLGARRIIRRGDKVLLHIGAANRDPARFAEPHQFSVDRPRGEALSFGLGRSRCIGISLALTQARIFLNTLHAVRGARPIVFGAPMWAHGLAGRSFHSLPAVVAPH